METAPPAAGDDGLRRSTRDRMVAGVCGGFAERFGYATWKVRAVCAAAFIITLGLGVIVYVLLAALVPVDEDPAPRTEDEPPTK